VSAAGHINGDGSFDGPADRRAHAAMMTLASTNIGAADDGLIGND
jgi:hypothetical protein